MEGHNLPSQDVEVDKFRPAFKYYKSKQIAPALSEVIEVDDNCQHVCRESISAVSESVDEELSVAGLRSICSWKVYNFPQHPGLLVIKNPFTPEGQRQWIQRCICEYPRPPNRTNLPAHGVDLKDSSWWEVVQAREGRSKECLMKQLRWVTLGYHHNWDTKEYNDGDYAEMPESVKQLCYVVSNALGYKQFKAEAAIVNYYHQGSTLAPHTDHSEPFLEAPLFSFSFGQSAIFLIGGITKSVSPSALYLHSGDIMIMNKQSRCAYHAVPLILCKSDKVWSFEESSKSIFEHNSESNHIINNYNSSNSFPDKEHSEYCRDESSPSKKRSYNDLNTDKKCDNNKKSKCLHLHNNHQTHSESVIKCIDSICWVALEQYLLENRININVRQVLPPNENKIKL